MKNYGDYDVLEFGDSLLPGIRLKIEHQVGCENAGTENPDRNAGE